ncbi:MAG: hypothetical protein HYU84_01330 [Chloroflexi bacterium]|nr:hypothetical protein [Chloroflexota bacterium]MBI3170100.1 hypothetical protein [Chloroflexota bacterium]
MSKLTTRVVLAVLISLGIILGVFMSVQAAGLIPSGKSVGMYVLSGGLVNPLQSQSSSEMQGEAQPQSVDPYSGDKGDGHGCDSEDYVDPSDL